MGSNSSKTVSLSLVHFPVYSLGIGKRVGIWFQGCNLHCRGCIADYTWNIEKGQLWSVEKLICDVAGMAEAETLGVTVSGGEPFVQPFQLNELVKGLRKHGIYDIMVYSGYSYPFLKNNYSDILGNIAAIVTGPFEQGNISDKAWKGSGNQRMHILTEVEELKRKYREYKKSRCGKRKLQIIDEKSGMFVIGIPRQKDSEVIRNGFCENMPDLQDK